MFNGSSVQMFKYSNMMAIWVLLVVRRPAGMLTSNGRDTKAGGTTGRGAKMQKYKEKHYTNTKFDLKAKSLIPIQIQKLGRRAMVQK